MRSDPSSTSGRRLGHDVRPVRGVSDVVRGPLARLHGDTERADLLQQLPPVAAGFARAADLRDEHVAALVLWCCIGCGLVVASGVWGGIASALPPAVALVAVPAGLAIRWRHRQMHRLVAALPTFVDMFGRSLSSGASFVQALNEAAADSPPALAADLHRIVGDVRLGRTPAHALRAWAGRTDSAEVRLVAGALAVASEHESGTGLAISGLSASLADRAVLVAEVRTQSAQAIASVYALVALPIGFVFMDAVGGGTTVRFLISDTLGRVCLIAAIILDVLGWAWMRTIVGRRVPT